MRPEDIKVGTVFKYKDSDENLRVITNISARTFDCKYLSGNLQGIDESDFIIRSSYVEEYLVAIFIPSQLENTKQQESNLILPPYYATDTPYEPFQIADFYNMNIREFSALKYLLRSKDESKRVEDLKKAITCIHKEIIRLESLKESSN